MTDGEQLRLFIDNQAKSKISIARELGITKQSLFQYFQSTTLAPETKKRFEDYFKESIFTEQNKSIAAIKKNNNESELVASLRREIASHEREIATLEKHCGLIEKLYQEKIVLFEANLNTALKNQARLVRQVSVALHLIAEHRAAGDREKLKAELDKIDMLNAEVLS